MSREISLNSRLAGDAQISGELEVVLLHITHESLSEPIKLSTDNVDRISENPLRYGTRSTWKTTDGSPFLFTLLSARLPDDNTNTISRGVIIIDNLDFGIGESLRATTTQATVDMAVVLASSPDIIEHEQSGLLLQKSSGDMHRYELELGRTPLSSQSFPKDRFTPDRFRGLFG
ncbi:MAG: hypothetical protein AAF468_20210 [Pseudomonadota bacterium]